MTGPSANNIVACLTKLGAVAHRERVRSPADMCEVVRCGDYLIEAKEQLPHGEWEPWVAEHLNTKIWVVQLYMKLAIHEKENPGSVTQALSIQQANRSLRKSVPRRKGVVEECV